MVKMLPLWPKSDSGVQIGDGVEVAFPSSFIQYPLQSAERIQELGYNALVLGMHESLPEKMGNFTDLEKALHIWKQQGLSLIIKVHELRLDTLFKRLPFLDAIFWESRGAQNSTLDATQTDLATEEMRTLEQALNGRSRLIFYVPPDLKNPKRQARCLKTLCEEAGGKTTIAFSSRQGAPWQDHHPLHPFWESAAPLMPLVNTGLIGLGEGSWPTVPFDLFERCFPRCKGFQGPIALVNQLPGFGGALECSLWIGAQMAASFDSSELLAESWLKQRRPDLDFDSWRHMMQKGRAIALEITALKHATKDKKLQELYRLQCESLLAQLKFEQSFFANFREGGSPSLSDYFSTFAEEARGLLLEYAKALNVSLFSANAMKQKAVPEKRIILEENFFQI